MNNDIYRFAELQKYARAILGVDEGLSRADIKKVYRKLAKKYHPDNNPSDRLLPVKFAVISQAYEVLTSDRNLLTRRLDRSDVELFEKKTDMNYFGWWRERFFI